MIVGIGAAEAGGASQTGQARRFSLSRVQARRGALEADPGSARRAQAGRLRLGAAVRTRRPGVDGTVYGTAPIGQSVLQYADPQHLRRRRCRRRPRRRRRGGADRPPTPATRRPRRPSTIRSGTAGRTDHGQDHRSARRRATGFVYLYRAKGDARSERGQGLRRLRVPPHKRRLQDRPTSAPTARTRRPRRSRPTPIEIGFSDRWYYDALAIKAGGGKRRRHPRRLQVQLRSDLCGRSEATFNDAEGAFVANIDGPVRAIRSYVGANSGPLTERTNLFYRDRHVIVTDLRVHAVPGPLTYHDLSAAGLGMTYFDSANPGGAASQTASRTRLPTVWRTGICGTGRRVRCSRPIGPRGRSPLSFWPMAATGTSTIPLRHPTSNAGATPRPTARVVCARLTRCPNTDPRSTPAATLHDDDDRHRRSSRDDRRGRRQPVAATWTLRS